MKISKLPAMLILALTLSLSALADEKPLLEKTSEIVCSAKIIRGVLDAKDRFRYVTEDEDTKTMIFNWANRQGRKLVNRDSAAFEFPNKYTVVLKPTYFPTNSYLMKGQPVIALEASLRKVSEDGKVTTVLGYHEANTDDLLSSSLERFDLRNGVVIASMKPTLSVSFDVQNTEIEAIHVKANREFKSVNDLIDSIKEGTLQNGFVSKATVSCVLQPETTLN